LAPKKRNLSDRFYDLFERLFREIDQEAIEVEVRALREARPRASRKELAMFMTRKAAQKTATIGAAVGAVPGVFSVMALGPDIFQMVRQQSRLVLSIAFLYDQKPDLRKRFREVLATLAIASSASATKKGTQYLVTRSLQGTATRQLAKRIAGKYFGRKLSSAVVPALGFLLGGTINYLSVRAVGIAAQGYYSQLLRKQQAAKRLKRGTRKRKVSRPPAGSRGSGSK
jgi:hypothetical protein